MIDDDLRALLAQPPDRPLDGLEADIWAGAEMAVLAKRATRVIASCQLAVLLAAFVGSMALGAVSVSSAGPQDGNIGHAGARLAPSTLLLGLEP